VLALVLVGVLTGMASSVAGKPAAVHSAAPSVQVAPTTTTVPVAPTTTTVPVVPTPTTVPVAPTPTRTPVAPTPTRTPTPPPAPVPPAPAPPAPPPAPSGYGCAAALAYLQANANPEFTLECPGYADGQAGMTCVNIAGLCAGEHLIAISDPCPAAYMNEAYNSNSWSDSLGEFTRPIDPYGAC
jgi:hypothetical protein